mmetsp:Transcript_109223/g.308057  ORF Transcript_109223/g.308057 Transcript_109223/m.308057 type:complete len:212 (-) Transcript_109223:655-1290(-)
MGRRGDLRKARPKCGRSASRGQRSSGRSCLRAPLAPRLPRRLALWPRFHLVASAPRPRLALAAPVRRTLLPRNSALLDSQSSRLSSAPVGSAPSWGRTRRACCSCRERAISRHVQGRGPKLAGAGLAELSPGHRHLCRSPMARVWLPRWPDGSVDPGVLAVISACMRRCSTTARPSWWFCTCLRTVRGRQSARSPCPLFQRGPSNGSRSPS